MESSGVSGGVFSGIGPGLLVLEMPLNSQHHPHHQQQQPRNPPTAQNLPQFHNNTPQMVGFSSHHETDHSLHQQPVKQGYPFGSKAKQQSPLSDDDEHGFNPDDGSAADAKRKTSPWQRMKWNDNMVRLLIVAVYYIGDEGGSEGNGSDPTGKKKVGGGLLQKKGKWKSVSRAMMEKGFYVSPQQCEDKFNDLNKRYKRVNDILGRGTACKVVENQSLLDAMDLSPKLKEEVRKLLNSKHLFFREMCAYHNSCGHGATAGASAAANQSPEVATEISQIQHQQSQQHQCLHSSENSQIEGNLGRIETEASKLAKVDSEEEDADEDEDDGDDEDEDEDDEDGAVDGHSRGKQDHEDNHGKPSRKRPRKGSYSMSPTPMMQQLRCEVMNVMQDGSKSVGEKKHWMKMRLLQLEEKQVSYQYQAFQLEKQRLKWLKFSGKKEREMERAKLENERRRLENERMVLLLRQKEFEVVDLHQPQPPPQPQMHSCNKRRDPSNISG
ncbi:putative serine/threonine-protein kinase mps1-like isoform X2 [Hibiscus syriacus]|uniref:Serine/threonine-protein kinase mps1-like isoform X2 n=1 Tax=Hibiscus syriacus TaxID=106335 RepID=A0A6A2Y6J1_HIBSY|nr:uncharacterized protein LOC120180831 [Hibiscus syriacus]XP_039042056.1 uncharacterized protein LOC120180831 [Hibiscus syriacus]KAE8666277.1 putative serine/threonine-protein kinase mps1-like isoform X2 [Hibiscus syriacus]